MYAFVYLFYQRVVIVVLFCCKSRSLGRIMNTLSQ